MHQVSKWTPSNIKKSVEVEAKAHCEGVDLIESIKHCCGLIRNRQKSNHEKREKWDDPRTSAFMTFLPFIQKLFSSADTRNPP